VGECEKPLGDAAGFEQEFMSTEVGAKKGVFGNYYMGMVGDNLTCTHMHRTRNSAKSCARKWLRFQAKVKAFKLLQRDMTRNL
jgi:hypothetical protein